jgi:hypothetical protein
MTKVYEGLIIGGPMAGQRIAQEKPYFSVMDPPVSPVRKTPPPPPAEDPRPVETKYVFVPLFVDPIRRGEIYVWAPVETSGKAEMMTDLLRVYEHALGRR